MKDVPKISIRHDGRGDTSIKENLYGSPILKNAVVKSIKTFKNGQTAGPDNITVEMTELLDEFAINMATDCLNVMHDYADILIDLSKSILLSR